MEKRSSGRVPSNLKIKLCLDDAINTGTISNLSQGGMLITTKVSFPLKSQFDILVPHGEEILKIPVKVSRLLKKDDCYDGIVVELLESTPAFLKFLDAQSQQNLIREKKKKTYRCSVCGYTAFGQSPVHCPFCRSSIDNFSKISGEINALGDFSSLSDFEKKHFPLVNVSKVKASDARNSTVNVHIRVGEIPHDMDIDDHIAFIDFYFDDFGLNKKCIARFNFNCTILSPETSLCICNTCSGNITVISNCTAHGSWMTEVSI